MPGLGRRLQAPPRRRGGRELCRAARPAGARSVRRRKRTLDVLGAVVALVLLAPLMAAIALAIRATSPGPALFSQVRMGRDRPFRLYKFRTMVAGAEQLKPALEHLNEAVPLFKLARDPRVTPVGAFLRRTSLDELPQLWNVLRGQMSLVGPRPLIPDEDCLISGPHRVRLDLMPGLTGPWQIAGRHTVPFEEMLEMDCRYVAEWSLRTDLRLLARTLPVVLFARGG